MCMPEKKPVRKIGKRYFTFFGGIAFCLFAVILILNGKYVARTIAFPFAFMFGLGSYAIYILLYSYGLCLFFREKGFKIRPNNYLFGGLLIFVAALMISTLIVTANEADPERLLTLKTFRSLYDDVMRNIEVGSEGPKATAYWDATFVNLFQGNKFGGGFAGYFLVGLMNNPLGGKPALSWVVAILIALLGVFLVFLPQFKKIIGINKGTKKTKAPKVQREERVITTRRVENIDNISSASTLDDANNEPSPIYAPQINKQPNFDERTEVNPELNNSGSSGAFGMSTNFVPARFNKFMPKAAPAVEKVEQVEPQPMTPEQAIMEANRESTINEQMQLNFEEKPQVNMELAGRRPEFVEPVQANPIPQPFIQPAPAPAPVQPAPQPVVKKPIKWIPPSGELLETLEIQDALDENNRVAEERTLLINQTFEDFNVGATVNSFVVGPSVTRYNIEYGSNVSVRSVQALIQDINVRLNGVDALFSPRVEGQRYSGLEVGNAKITPVPFKEVYEGLPDPKKHPLEVAFGKNIDGVIKTANFADFPHILVAGTTGSGKSVFTHSLICTLIMRNSPENLRLVLIDPKKVEMSKYKDIPHLLCPIINDAEVAKLTMDKLADEMNRRYDVLVNSGCSDIKQYAEARAEDPNLEPMPYIVVFIDEFADLVDTCKEIKAPVVSIAQKARACGIHMLIATQRPSTNIIDGVIKGNLPTRVALAVASQVDSVTILGEGGAEKLLGRGDMLAQSPILSRTGRVRLQSCFIQNKEILRIVGYLREHYEPNYDPNFCNLLEAAKQAAADVIGSPEFQAGLDNSEEEKYQSVKEWVMANEYMSMSRIQRECSVGFNRAGRFFKRLQDEGIVDTETEGNKGCPVLVHDKFYDGTAETDVPVSSDQSEIL